MYKRKFQSGRVSKNITSIRKVKELKMKKKFKMNELQCAHCAAKMEDAIKKIPGVESANINFMMQKLTVEADEENFDRIMEEAQKCCDKIEKGVKIVV